MWSKYSENLLTATNNWKSPLIFLFQAANFRLNSQKFQEHFLITTLKKGVNESLYTLSFEKWVLWHSVNCPLFSYKVPFFWLLWYDIPYDKHTTLLFLDWFSYSTTFATRISLGGGAVLVVDKTYQWRKTSVSKFGKAKTFYPLCLK